MPDMNKPAKNSAPMLIAAIVVAALIAVGVYFAMMKKTTGPDAQQTAESLAPTTTEQAVPEPTGPVVEGEVPPQPETPQNLVVETKKLDLPGQNDAGNTEVAPAPGANPTVDAMMGERSIGSASAPIKVIEYSSLTCSHCAEFHKHIFADLKTKYIDTGRVQMTFKEFPLNPPALDASQILRCMPADKFVTFMNLLFDQQENWAYKPDYKDFLRQNAKLAGMSDSQFDACLANTDLKERIVADMKKAGDVYKIQSTPSFVVNNGAKTIVGAQPLEFFEKTFNELSPAAGTSTATPATEPASAPVEVAPETQAPPAE